MPHRMLQVGESAPWFACRSNVNTQLRIDGYAGKYVVLCFFKSASDSDSQQVLNDIISNRQAFDDVRACFFGVSVDSEDESQGRVKDDLPGIRFLWDFDRAVSRHFGA